jgi:hypothetical protein
MIMTPDEAAEILEMNPEEALRLRKLCARRHMMRDGLFRDELAELLGITREMLDAGVAVVAAGLREDVEAGLISFEEALIAASGGRN